MKITTNQILEICKLLPQGDSFIYTILHKSLNNNNILELSYYETSVLKSIAEYNKKIKDLLFPIEDTNLFGMCSKNDMRSIKCALLDGTNGNLQLCTDDYKNIISGPREDLKNKSLWVSNSCKVILHYTNTGCTIIEIIKKG